MTLIGVMALILRYFTEFGSFRGALRITGWRYRRKESSRSLPHLLMSVLLKPVTVWPIGTKFRTVTQFEHFHPPAGVGGLCIRNITFQHATLLIHEIVSIQHYGSWCHEDLLCSRTVLLGLTKTYLDGSWRCYLLAVSAETAWPN